MKILAFDPAASCGFALLDGGRLAMSGVRKFKYPSEAQQRKGRKKGEKWLDFWDWSEELITSTAPDLVAAEDVRRHVSTLAGHSYGFYRYAIEALCARCGVNFLSIGVTQWKAISAKAGGAKKQTVAEAVRAIYGDIQFASDDESDAIGIAHAAQVMSSQDAGQEDVLAAGVGGRGQRPGTRAGRRDNGSLSGVPADGPGRAPKRHRRVAGDRKATD